MPGSPHLQSTGPEPAQPTWADPALSALGAVGRLLGCGRDGCLHFLSLLGSLRG